MQASDSEDSDQELFPIPPASQELLTIELKQYEPQIDTKFKLFRNSHLNFLMLYNVLLDIKAQDLILQLVFQSLGYETRQGINSSEDPDCQMHPSNQYKGPQKFCIKWKNRFDQFQTSIAEFIQHEVLCDVTLVTQQKIFKAHQFVLSACSTHFKEIFQSVPIAQHPIVFLRDVTSQEVECLLDYMYRGETVISDKLMPAFIKTCESLRIKGLCEDRAQNEPNTTNGAEDSRVESNKRKNTNFERDCVQRKQSKVADDLGKDSLDSEPGNDITQDNLHDDPKEASNINNNSILESPPFSQESLVFAEAGNKSEESLVFLSDSQNQILEISDDDSIVGNASKHNSQLNFLKNLDLNQTIQSSDETPEDFVAVSPNESVQLNYETDESEIITRIEARQKRHHLSTSSGHLQQKPGATGERTEQDIPENNYVNKQSQGLSKGCDHGVSKTTSPDQSDTIRNQLKVVLNKLPWDYHSRTKTPDENESEVQEDGGLYQSIDNVPENLKQFFCRTCRKCIKKTSWKSHLRSHSLNFAQKTRIQMKKKS